MNPKIYPFQVHQLSLDKIDSDALYVMEKLRANGFIAYLVGGSVRDLLLNHKPKDFDISTSAEPEQIKQLFRNCILIGRRFRLAHIRFGKKVIEVSTFRSGDNETDTLILRDNKWGSPEEDVRRRDFTINGLFYDAATQEVIDYVDGYTDIQQQLLRTIGQSFIRFRQDPVRMLRLLKFQARFGLNIDPVTHNALLECRHEIIKSSPARILEELLRMLESGSSEPFFRKLAEHGFFDLIIPALAKSMKIAEEEEILSYLKEADTICKDTSREPPTRSVLLACLVFPLLEQRLHKHYLDREIIPHLGEVAQEAQEQIHDLFFPFLHLSRKMKGSLISILVSQYRLTPLEKKKHRRIRIPNDPDFPQALQFFEIRAALEPAFQSIWKEWTEPRSESSKASEKRPRRRKRTKRSETSPTQESPHDTSTSSE